MNMPPLNLSLADDTRQATSGQFDASGWTVATGGASASGARYGSAAEPAIPTWAFLAAAALVLAVVIYPRIKGGR